MSIWWTLINDLDKKMLTLGTGMWPEILYDVAGPIQAHEAAHVLARLRADEAMKTWGDARLQEWASIIAEFMNSSETRLIHDAGNPEDFSGPDPDDYDSIGYLKDLGTPTPPPPPMGRRQ